MAEKVKTKKKMDGSARMPVGRPEMYKPEYCAMLLEHMKEGRSFASFGAKVDACWTTLVNWLEGHEEFLRAKTMGEIRSLAWWENLNQAQASGSLRRVVSEEYARDENGQVIFQGGQPVVSKRTYEATRGDSRAIGIALRNRFRKFYGEEITVRLKGLKKDPAELTDDELDAELKKVGDG